jgi:hypothetical protein
VIVYDNFERTSHIVGGEEFWLARMKLCDCDVAKALNLDRGSCGWVRFALLDDAGRDYGKGANLQRPNAVGLAEALFKRPQLSKRELEMAHRVDLLEQAIAAHRAGVVGTKGVVPCPHDNELWEVLR